MRYLRSFGVLLLAALPCSAWAQAPVQVLPSQPQQQYGGSVSGHVYCADTNAPARFARVTLMPVRAGDNNSRGFGGGGNSQSTGMDGSFQISNVAPGMYYVTAIVPGYLSLLSQVAYADLTSSDAAAQERVAKVVTPVRVSGNEGVHTEIRLERGASISGTVFYDDGSPAVNVVVSTKPATSDGTTTGNMQSGFGQQAARTDDYGRYRVTGVPSGDYAVMASSQLFDMGGFNGGGRGQQSTTLTIYAPKSFRMVDAKTFTLKTGSEVTGADVLIPLAAFHTVSGGVESSDGHTLNSGSLTLTDDKDKTHSFRSSVQSDGKFSILYVPEGSYTLSIAGAAMTEPDTGSGDRFNRTKTVQSYRNTTQSVLVQSGDLSGVVVQVSPVTQSTSAGR